MVGLLGAACAGPKTLCASDDGLGCRWGCVQCVGLVLVDEPLAREYGVLASSKEGSLRWFRLFRF